MGLHTGTPLVTDEGYVGDDVHRAARIAACGHGGQVLVSASTAALVQADGLRDLGEHRLEGLSAPERIYQLGEKGVPPLESLHRTNLPIPATTFLGREAELDEVARTAGTRRGALAHPHRTRRHGQDPACPAGRRQVSDAHPDGVFWVPLAPLRDLAVVQAAAQALGAEDGLADHIADKRLLLPDNFEHIVDAAADLAGLSAPSVAA